MLVRQEGNRSVRRQISHYNLKMIIAVGYRVKLQVATRFRQWATDHLREFIQKDDERLKGNRRRYIVMRRQSRRLSLKFEKYRKLEMLQ